MEHSTLFDHWMVLYRRKWILLLIVVSAVVTAWLLGDRLPLVYEAKAVFFVPAQPDRPTFLVGEGPRTIGPTLVSPTPKEDAHASSIGMLQSKTLAKRVLQGFPQKRLYDLQRNVDVELSSEFMLQVFVRDRDPKVAADIANAYFTHFNEAMRTASGRTTVLNQQTIESHLGESRQNLAAARKALQAFEAGQGIADLSTQTAELVRQKSSFESTLESVRVSLREVESKIAGTQLQLVQEASLYVPTELVTTSPAVDRLKKDVADLEAAIGGRSTEVGERHPDLQALRAQYQAKRRELAAEIETIIKSQTKTTGSLYEDLRRSLTTLLVDKEVTEARQLGLQRTIARIEAKLAKLPEVKAKHTELVRQVEVSQRHVELLVTDLEEARIHDKREMQVGILVDPATAPEDPAFPVPWLNNVVAAGLGLVAGIFYCFLLDYIQRVRLARRIRASAASGVRLEGL